MEQWVKASRRWTLAVLSGALLSFNACGPMRPARAPGAAALRFDVGERKLTNGLRLVTHPDSSAGLTAAVLIVGAGAGRDPEGKEGLAHLVEHLAFRALDADGRSTRRRFESLSASYNGWTDSEETGYVATVPSSRSDALLGIFEDLLTEPLRGVDEATFRVERSVVENERRMRSENGFPLEVFARLNRALYGASYYGKPIGGSAESLSRLTLADAVEFARAHYRPEHMTLLVAGPQADGEALARTFGAVTPEGTGASAPDRSLREPVSAGLTPLERTTAVVGTPELWLAWRLPGGFAEQRAKLEVIEDMAENSMAQVTSDRTDVAAVQAFVEYGPIVSTLYCRATLSATDDVEGVRRALAHALDRGIAETAFDAYWRQIFTRDGATRRMLDFEPLAWRAQEMALGAHYAKSARFAIAQTSAIEALSGSELNEVADRYLNLEQSRALLVEPHAAAVGDERRHEDAHGGASGGAAPVATRVEPTLEDPRVLTSTLENGLEVIAVERPGDRFYTALLGFYDGEARNPLGVARAARFATVNYLVKPPAGIDFASSLGVDSVTWRARSNASALDLGLGRLIDRFTNIELNWKSRYFLEWRKVAEKVETASDVADRELMRSLLGDTLLAAPRPADFDSIRVQDIRKWRDAVHRPENASLVIVGPDAEQSLSSARAHLAGWKRAVARAPEVKPPALPKTRGGGLWLALVPKTGLSQTVLRFGCRLPQHSAQGIAAEQVLAERLEHSLERALRETTGSTYHVDVDVERLRGGLSVLRISTAVGNSQLEQAVGPLLDWLTTPSPLFDEEAVDASRHTLSSRFVFEVSTTGGLAERIFDQRRLGFEPEFYSSYAKRLAAVSAASVDALVAQCRKDAVLAAAGKVDEVERLAAPFAARLR
jgi:zinc protease